MTKVRPCSVINTVKIEILDEWLAHGERQKPLTGIILHHTAGGTAESSIDFLRTIGLSYHYVPARDGRVFKCVPISGRAFHAGVSVGKFGSDVNSQTIGISFANLGDGETYPPVQIQAAHELIDAILSVHKEIDWISTHRLITSRKIDPAFFGFRQFCSQHPSLEMWMDESLGRDWDG